jgi:hypothetical protein
MKNLKFLWPGTALRAAGILAAALALAFAACSNPSGGGGDPPLTGSVTITGTAKVGGALTANTGSLDGSGAISYQWQISGSAGGTYANIPSATNSTYTPAAADEGKYLKVTVTRAGYSGSVTSPATAAVAAAGPSAITGSVTVTGFAKVGGELTADTAGLGGSGAISYQWQISGSADGTYDDIPGETNGAYTPAAADEGKYLKVTVTRAGYSGSVTSPATAAVADANAAPPVVTGVTVTGPDSVAKGGMETYTAEVAGTGSPPQTVIWTIVETGGNPGTGIDNTGKLTVAGDEALDTITVKAASTLDPGKSNTKTVTITGGGPPPSGPYTVTFHPNGGSPAPAQQSVAANGTASQPPSMTKAIEGLYKGTLILIPSTLPSAAGTPTRGIPARRITLTPPLPGPLISTPNGRGHLRPSIFPAKAAIMSSPKPWPGSRRKPCPMPRITPSCWLAALTPYPASYIITAISPTSARQTPSLPWWAKAPRK